MWNRRKNKNSLHPIRVAARPRQPARPQPPKEGIPMSTVSESPDRVPLIHPARQFVRGKSVIVGQSSAAKI